MTQPQGDAGQAGDQAAGADGGGYKPPATQADLDKIIGERVARTKAQFADYDTLKAEADQLRALADGSKSDTDKLRDELEALKTERAEERVETLRLKVANANGITDAEDVRLFLTGSDEQTLTAQAKRLSERTANNKKNGNRVPNEGTSAPAGGNADRAFARSLLGGGD